MNLRFKNTAGETVSTALFGGGCGYGAYWLLTNNPTQDGKVWGMTLAVLAVLAAVNVLRGYS